jgi:RsmE family RNA methyltransferase
MNLILLEPDDFTDQDHACLRGRRLVHVRDQIRATPGDPLRVGVLGGMLGEGRILSLEEDELELEVRLYAAPPPPSPVALVLALPRPPSLRKVLQQATAMGVKRFVLLHSRRVEKSYWQSSGLAEDAIRRQLLLGLEQSRDTILPEVELRRRFRPFVEDELPGLLEGGRGLVAHPESPTPCPRALVGPTTLVVGPEGGFLSREIEQLEAQGLQGVGLGERVLRVETAVVALLARIAP